MNEEERKKSYNQAKKSISYILQNVLKSSARSLLDKNSIVDNPEERKIQMQVIEEFTNYIQDFDENMYLVHEYKDMVNRMMDDGR